MKLPSPGSNVVDVTRTHDGEEAARLLATGGRLRRLAHDMAVDLDASKVPPAQAAPPEIRLGALDCDAEDIALSAASATTPDHVDFPVWARMNRVEYWRRLLDGKGPCGAILREPSRLLRGRGGLIVGAVVVTEMEATDWWAADPWLPEVFVVSGFQGRGLGGLLLGHALRACAGAGYERLGLTVSEGNPARHLYERFGFESFRATWFIEPRRTARP
jgi:mycothiol synthase